MSASVGRVVALILLAGCGGSELAAQKDIRDAVRSLGGGCSSVTDGGRSGRGPATYGCLAGGGRGGVKALHFRNASDYDRHRKGLRTLVLAYFVEGENWLVCSDDKSVVLQASRALGGSVQPAAKYSG